MNRTPVIVTGLLTTSLLAFTPLATAQESATTPPNTTVTTVTNEVQVPADQPTIDLVICLDTSNSMDGLINAARTKIWQIVNDLALAEPTPRLRIALLDYGNDSLDPETGWVRIDSPFTEDLDLISQQLFGLTTDGGTEYVGRVLQRSLENLDWTESDKNLKLIVVSGNESANQDPDYNFQEVCRALIAKGIMVNSIYCGGVADDDAPGWTQIAKLTDGQFASIDPNYESVAIATPFDEQMTDLSGQLNTTYIPLGVEGQASWANQAQQDENAYGASIGGGASRARTKGSSLYYCGWDLCDAIDRKEVDLETIDVATLPEEMRTMTKPERLAYVETKRTERKKIQDQIQDLDVKREAFITEARKDHAENEDQAFDVAVRKAIRTQAENKGFSFPNQTVVNDETSVEATEETKESTDTSS